MSNKNKVRVRLEREVLFSCTIISNGERDGRECEREHFEQVNMKE